MEHSYTCVSKQYPWHMIIESKWEDMQWMNSPYGILNHFPRYFQFNLGEISSLCNEGKINIIG